jgi:hypothetical protein
MAIVISELFKSRRIASGEAGFAEVLVRVTGSNDAIAMLVAIESWAVSTIGSTFNGAPIETVEVVDQVKSEDWTGLVRYSNRAAQVAEDGDSTFEFDTSGGTQRITAGNSVAAYNGAYSPFGAAPAFGGGINVTENGVEGVDVEFPGMDWSETHYFAASDIDSAFKLAVYGLTKKVNNASFKGFAAYTTQFRSAKGGGKIGQGIVPITFSFRSSPNLVNVNIAGIPNINKRAWEYLWIYYRPQEDETANAVTPQPVAAYVHEIPGYEPADFAGLGIGT